jgi:hypothetical protein
MWNSARMDTIDIEILRGGISDLTIDACQLSNHNAGRAAREMTSAMVA